MKVLDLTAQTEYKAGIVAFGFFDTIHLGHKKVIKDAVNLARSMGVPSSVFLFKNNIFPLFGVEKHPLRTFEERISLIEPLGVDQILYVEARRGFLDFSKEEFCSYLDHHILIDGFTCGKDFTFGKGGEGTPADLILHYGDQHVISDLCLMDGEKVSSESVKTALFLGDVAKAERLLGEKYALTRIVTSGRKDGSKMGFPTVNFEIDRLPLKRGVYFTNLYAEGKRYRAVTNVGAHPTFADQKENVETYILDFFGDLYDKVVKVEFLSYRREIVAFKTIEDLSKQISADVRARREYD